MVNVIVSDIFLLNSFALAGLRCLKLMGDQLIDIKEFVVTTLRSEKNAFESQDDTGKLAG